MTLTTKEKYSEVYILYNILCVQVVVTSHTQTGNYFHVFTALFKFLHRGLLVMEVCQWPKEGGGGGFL